MIGTAPPDHPNVPQSYHPACRQVMLISVITPVLNGGKTIGRTLQSLSIQRARFEHIVMDGGSQDATEKIVEQYRNAYAIDWCQAADAGVYDAVWKGMQRAKGDVLAWINADDFYMPWTLAVVQQVFERWPEVHWLTGIPSWYFEDSGLSVTSPYAPVYPQTLIRHGLYTGGRLGALQQESMFWRRSLWEKDPSALEDITRRYRYAADFHLWRHFARHARLYTVSAALACFTVSSDQLSGTFRSRYASESGASDSSFAVPAAGRLFNRIVATVRSGSVIRPSNVSRDVGNDV